MREQPFVPGQHVQVEDQRKQDAMWDSYRRTMGDMALKRYQLPRGIEQAVNYLLGRDVVIDGNPFSKTNKPVVIPSQRSLIEDMKYNAWVLGERAGIAPPD